MIGGDGGAALTGNGRGVFGGGGIVSGSGRGVFGGGGIFGGGCEARIIPCCDSRAKAVTWIMPDD